MTRHAKHRADKHDPSADSDRPLDSDEQDHDADTRPPRHGLPFGENPQDHQGEDPASGGS